VEVLLGVTVGVSVHARVGVSEGVGVSTTGKVLVAVADGSSVGSMAGGRVADGTGVSSGSGVSVSATGIRVGGSGDGISTVGVSVRISWAFTRVTFWYETRVRMNEEINRRVTNLPAARVEFMEKPVKTQFTSNERCRVG
jgi:hypothetical protein